MVVNSNLKKPKLSLGVPQWEQQSATNQQQQNDCRRKESSLSHWGINVFYWYQIFALDSVVVRAQEYLVCMEVSLLLQCIIIEKQSNQLNILY